MDAPTTYGLPLDVIDSASIRTLSDAEMMEVARNLLQHCLLPSDTRLWEAIQRTPSEEREDHFGPYLMRAYAEFEFGNMNSAPSGFNEHDLRLLARLKMSAAKYGFTPEALLLAGETEAEFQRCALVPILGPFPHAVDKAVIGEESLANWPAWVPATIIAGVARKHQRDCP
jgi:hypothetical protein